MTASRGDFERLPCPLGWRDARCGRFGPCGCEPPINGYGAGPDYATPSLQPDNQQRAAEDVVTDFGDQVAEDLARFIVSYTQGDNAWGRMSAEARGIYRRGAARFVSDALMPAVEAALDRSNRLAFQAGWNHATAEWEQRARALVRELRELVTHADDEAREWEGDPHRVSEWEGKASAYAWASIRLRELLAVAAPAGQDEEAGR